MKARRYSKILISLGTSLIILGIVGTSVRAAAGFTTLVSVASDGTQGNRDSFGGVISGNGRYIAFGSDASNLVPNDTNNDYDIFVCDLFTRQTERVSVASDGMQGIGASINAFDISADGRYVAFSSWASNLVPNDTNGTQDVFMHDRLSGTTQLVSIDSNGIQGNSLSGFTMVNISDDGRYVGFYSDASNLVLNDTNGKDDVFVHDILSGQTRRVSVASDGTEANGGSGIEDMSSDGRYVVFSSGASNLVPNDTNGVEDDFIHDNQSGQTYRVSIASNGSQANNSSSHGSISPDGRYIVFISAATNLVPGDTNGKNDVFVHDMQTSQTTRVSISTNGSQGNDDSDWASISSNRRYIVFPSNSNNLIPGDTNGLRDIFVHDMISAETFRVSVASNGEQANGYSWQFRRPSISFDGRLVAFDSDASNLVSGDTNGVTDVFVHENDVPVEATWTIMVYLDGDNSLNANYLYVFNQLEYAANNPNINILVAWDQSGNNNSAYYKINYDTDLNHLGTYTEGKDRWNKGELDMGDPTSLSDFVQWARTNYPTQHYALLISNHGTGLNGTAQDITNGNDWITVSELGNALSTATSNGSNKLDIVFADSCLMGMIEDGYQIRNYANIYIASENQIWIPGSGSRPYSNYLAGITSSITPQELATNIVTEYASWLDNAFPGKYGYTLSAVDLTKIDTVITAISNLSSAMRAQIATYAAQIKTARNTAQKFDSDGNNVINTSDEYVDLADLASELKAIPDSSIQTAAQDVIDALVTYVITSTAKSGSSQYPSPSLDPTRVHGVSIFFPSGDSKRSFYNGLNLDFAAGTIWGTQSSPAVSLSSSTSDWGSLLVDYVENITPAATDDSNPPELISPLEPDFIIYLPLVNR